MPSKRILVLTNRVPYPLNDGGNLAMNAMIEGYVNQGWEVYLLSMNTSRHFVKHDILTRIYKNVYSFETVDVDNSVTVLQMATNFFFSNQPNHVDRFKSKPFENKLIEVLKDFKPNVVQMESVFLATYLDEIKSNSNALNILRLHNVESEIWKRLSEESKSIIKKYYLSNLANRIKRFEEHVWSMFDLLLPITNIDAERVMNIVPSNKVLTAPYGISGNTMADDVEEQWVGYHIGAMDWQPNIEGVKWFIYEVLPIVRSQVVEFEFYYAGRNMPDDMVSISEKGIYCEGMVEDANSFIADKKILIVPIHSGGGIRVKVLEAMNMSKVVISTKIGIQGIDVVPNIHFLQADTAQEFADAIKWCLSNKEKAREIAENARQLIAEKYSVDKIMTAIDMHLTSLTN